MLISAAEAPKVCSECSSSLIDLAEPILYDTENFSILRKLRTFIPTLPQSLKQLYPTVAHQKLLKRRQRAQHKYGDNHTRTLPAMEKHQPISVSVTKVALFL